MEPDPAYVARQHAEALQTVQALVARAGPAVAFVTVDETQRTDWGAELRDAAVDVVFSALSHGGHDASGTDTTHRHTLITARDGTGAPLASLHAADWYGRALLPALAAWARETGRSGVWRHRDTIRVTFDGRYPLQHPPVLRGAPAICADLAVDGWTAAGTSTRTPSSPGSPSRIASRCGSRRAP